ncbi:MAG: hypothetical protein JO358_15085 [Alphaproteobacteria bacterium]|nr:hypothetical protein [Alphaproteobacteria bacterium]
MLSSVRNHWFRLAPTLVFAALSLFALALPLSPAKAQCLGVDLGFGCAGLGVGSWYTHPYYYGYPYAAYPTYPVYTYPYTYYSPYYPYGRAYYPYP